jgi:hypothetical protein
LTTLIDMAIHSRQQTWQMVSWICRPSAFRKGASSSFGCAFPQRRQTNSPGAPRSGSGSRPGADACGMGTSKPAPAQSFLHLIARLVLAALVRDLNAGAEDLCGLIRRPACSSVSPSSPVRLGMLRAELQRAPQRRFGRGEVPGLDGRAGPG